MENITRFIGKTFTFNLGKLEIEPTYWQAATIIFLIFLLFLTFARVRYLYLHWSLGSNAVAMLFWGFVLTLIFEGFMLIGGRTLLTEIIGIRNVPKPISTILDMGRTRLSEVLGESLSPVPGSYAKDIITSEDVITSFSELSKEDSEKAKEVICKP